MKTQIGAIAYRNKDKTMGAPKPIYREGVEIDTRDLARVLLNLMLKDLEGAGDDRAAERV